MTLNDVGTHRRHRRARQRTPWLATGAWTLAVALLAWWLLESRLSGYREQSLATSTVRLNAIKDTLSITFRQLAALPLSLAHRTAVTNYLDARLASKAPREPDRQEINQTLDRIAADFALPLVILIDRNGNLAGTTGSWRNQPQSSETNLGNREYFVEAIDKGMSMQFLLGRATKLPGLYFANRVESNGATVGVAVVKQDAETLNRLLRDADGSRIFVSDANGVVVLGNYNDMLLQRLPDAPQRPAALYEAVYHRVPTQLAWQASRHGAGARTLQLTTIDDLQHLTLSSPLGDTSFRVWVLDPLDDEPLIARNVGAGALVIWLVGLLLIWLSWRHLRSLDDALQARRETFELTQALPLTVFRYQQPIKGAPHFSFIGRGVEELFGVDAEQIERDPQLPWRLTGTGDHPPTRPQEFFVQRDDDNAWLLADSTSMLEPDGSITYNGYWLDISVRRETEARFAAVFEHAPAGYVFFDATHGISHVNTAGLRLLGTNDPHQVLGRILWFPG
ncbi:MAG TPA: PAS domain-containing protein, partial [Burkholderiaceae bacterium]|nr:PAS domain-containing protein [Burkholderiaceae bacterium]